MQSIRFETTVDDAMAGAMPPLRPMLGKRVRMIAVTDDSDVAADGSRLSVDDLLARRIDAPPGQPPLTAEDIDRAIAAACGLAR